MINFLDFKLRIKDFTNQPLGGLDSQLKLASLFRIKLEDYELANKNPRKAAVLGVFYPNEKNETYFLLTQRANYNGVHSSQISFPGGKYEEADNNLEQTALRETFEEVGINPKKIHIIRKLTSVYIPPSNFLATPFIGYLEKKPRFILNNEVVATIEVKLSDLLKNANLDTVNLNTSYSNNVDVPCFKLNNYVVWGATAMMLSELKDLIKSL